MNIQEAWSRALRETEIVRSRILSLHTFEATPVPYILLSASAVNVGDTVVRRGEVVVDRPALILPPNVPQFEGFSFQDVPGQDDAVLNFLLVRGVSLPSLKYNNKSMSLDVFEGGLADAVRHYGNQLQQREDTATGLLVGPEDAWQFSLLIFTCSQIARNSAADFRRLLDDFRRRNA